MTEPPKDEKPKGPNDAPPTNPALPNLPPMTNQYKHDIPTPEQIQMQELTDHCATRFLMSGVVGGGLGAAMGLVFGVHEPVLGPGGEPLQQTWKEALRHGARQSAKASWGYAKTFSAFGAIYASSECVIEQARAKHDIYNSGLAGCFTGGALAYKTGPQGIAMGCASVAAFSMAIDHFLGT